MTIGAIVDVASSFLVDQSAVVGAEGQGTEVLFLCTKAEPDLHCAVHEPTSVDAPGLS